MREDLCGPRRHPHSYQWPSRTGCGRRRPRPGPSGILPRAFLSARFPNSVDGAGNEIKALFDIGTPIGFCGIKVSRMQAIFGTFGSAGAAGPSQVFLCFLDFGKGGWNIPLISKDHVCNRISAFPCITMVNLGHLNG